MIGRVWRALAYAAALLCSAVALLPAQTADSARTAAHARLLGAFDGTTGEPIAGLQVRDAFGGAYALTSATGAVRLSYLTFRGSAALVQLMKLGYEEQEIVVAENDTVPITIVMDRAVTLPPVVSSERYRLDRDAGHWEGFEQRCESKNVTCFKAAQLAARPTENMADFLVHAPGVVIGACGSDKTRASECGRVSMRSATIPPAYCEPSIFVNGFLWNPQMSSAIDMRPNTPPAAPFTPANVKGVEVYSTELSRPLRFEGDPLCGAIVVWTK